MVCSALTTLHELFPAGRAYLNVPLQETFLRVLLLRHDIPIDDRIEKGIERVKAF